MQERAVTALLGPTNTGKTHLAIERMLTHPTGMIGFPLRLLARENYDRVAALRGADAVALVTGEERIVPKQPAYWMCTVEAMPPDLRTDFLAVDEVQLAADRERGHVFTDRIQHARGRLETWLIGAETIRPLLKKLLPDAAFTEPAAPLDAALRGAEAARQAAAALGRDRLLGARALRGGRAAAARARRRGARVRRALAAHPQRAGGALPGGRRRPPGGDRRDRDGAEPRHRPRRLHEPRQVRRGRAAAAHSRRGGPDRGPRRAPRDRRPVRRDRRARRDGPAAGGGGRVAPLRAAHAPAVADRRARLLLAARAPRQPRAPAAAPLPAAHAARRGPAHARRAGARRGSDGAGARPRLRAPAVGGLPGAGLPERADRGAHAPAVARVPLPARARGADPRGLPRHAREADRPHRGRPRHAARAHRRDPDLDLHLEPLGVGARRSLLAGAHARGRGPPLRRAPRAADAGVRGPGRHRDRAPRPLGARDERDRRRRGAGAGPARGRAHGLPLPAGPRHERRLARAARGRQPRPARARPRAGAGASSARRTRPSRWARGRAAVARRRGGDARRGRERAQPHGSRCWARTSSTRRSRRRCAGASPRGWTRTCAGRSGRSSHSATPLRRAPLAGSPSRSRRAWAPSLAAVSRSR